MPGKPSPVLSSQLTIRTHLMSSASTYAVGRGAPHHPPAGIHLQRGEFLAYNYLHIVLDAINMAEQDMRNMTNAEISTGSLPYALWFIEIVDSFLKLSQQTIMLLVGKCSQVSLRWDSPAVTHRRVTWSISMWLSCSHSRPRTVHLLPTRSCFHTFLLTAYQTELDRLQPQVLPEAQHCSPECASRAVCYTSFLPNWNPSHLLESVIVGNMDPADSNTWKYKNMGSRDERMGYKDIKALYEVSSPPQ